jgi:hypothetical protein
VLSDPRPHTPPAAAADFNSPAVALTDLVLWLGAHLTSTDDVHRQRACATLAECLARGDRIILLPHAAQARVGQTSQTNSHLKKSALIFENHRSIFNTPTTKLFQCQVSAVL